MSENVFETVKKTILETVSDISADIITHNISLTELGIDSIKVVELGVRLEEVFGDCIVLDEWLDVEMDKSQEVAYKVSCLVDYIEKAISQ